MTIQDEMRKYVNLLERAPGFSDKFLYMMHRHTTGTGYKKMFPRSQADFDAAFQAEAPTQTKSFTAYRGLGLDSWSDLAPAENFLERDVLEFADYLPTSLSRDIALTMTSYHFSARVRILYAMQTLPGVKAVYMPDLRGLHADYTFLEREMELVIDKGSKFRVVSKQQGALPFNDSTELDPESWEVELEMVR